MIFALGYSILEPMTERQTLTLPKKVGQELARTLASPNYDSAGAIALLSESPQALGMLLNLVYNRPELAVEKHEEIKAEYNEIR